MADNGFRAYQTRHARDERDPIEREMASDPLAELARLIGQSDPYAEGGANARAHDAYGEAHARDPDDVAGPGVDWAAEESYPGRQDRTDDRYAAPPPPPASYEPRQAAASYGAPDRGYEDEPRLPDSQYYSGPARQFDTQDADYPDPDRAASPSRPLPAFPSAPSHERYEADEPEYEDVEEAYADEGDDYASAPSRRRRGGLLVVMAVFGLAVVGTAGAFGYRAMFGGSVWPSLPPIIKASTTPNKITPSYGQAHANNQSQSSPASAGPSENMVSREEQPVPMEQPPAAPRVVSTIPITSAPAPAASNAPAPPPWPTSPAPMPGAPTPPANGAAAAPTPSPPPVVAAPPPAPGPAEPKKVHTVTIRNDANADAAPAAAPAPPKSAARPTPAKPSPPSVAAAPPPTTANAPLSIVPGAESDAAAPLPAPAPAPSRTRMAAAPIALASAEPGVGGVAAASGGYAVQVTSQRSEAEAQASFKALQAKYPSQLGGRHPMIGVPTLVPRAPTTALSSVLLPRLRKPPAYAAGLRRPAATASCSAISSGLTIYKTSCRCSGRLARGRRQGQAFIPS